MDNNKFSVLMSVYKNDVPKYVDDAIKSLLDQTLPPNQIVIMVDGPIGPDLDNILKKYIHNNLFTIYYRKENKGLGITLNEGLKKCKYDYVARMDADDVSEKNRFETQMNFMKKHPNISVLGCAITEYDENMEKVVSYKEVPQTSSEIQRYVKKRNPINHPTVIFKKQDVIKSGNYEDYLYFEDYYLWAKMISHGFLLFNLNEKLYRFRGGKSMYGRRGGIKYLKHIMKLEKGLLELGIINKFEYAKNIFIRFTAAIVPNKIRTIAYKIFLRKKVKKSE